MARVVGRRSRGPPVRRCRCRWMTGVAAVTQPRADVRLTYHDAALGAATAGRGLAPLLLFEVAGSRTLIVTGAAPPPSSIAAVEAAIAAGLPHWPAGGLGDRTVPAAGWSVRLNDSHAELRGPDRVWAHGLASTDAGWCTALANCAGRAIVLYGPMLSARPGRDAPQGFRCRQATRRARCRHQRRRGRRRLPSHQPAEDLSLRSCWRSSILMLVAAGPTCGRYRNVFTAAAGRVSGLGGRRSGVLRRCVLHRAGSVLRPVSNRLSAGQGSLGLRSFR
jgi:hypothetical protein